MVKKAFIARRVSGKFSGAAECQPSCSSETERNMAASRHPENESRDGRAANRRRASGRGGRVALRAASETRSHRPGKFQSVAARERRRTDGWEVFAAESESRARIRPRRRSPRFSTVQRFPPGKHSD